MFLKKDSVLKNSFIIQFGDKLLDQCCCLTNKFRVSINRNHEQASILFGKYGFAPSFKLMLMEYINKNVSHAV